MKVAAKKLATSRMRKDRAAAASPSSDIENSENPSSLASHSSSSGRMTPSKNTRSRKGVSVKDVSNHKITEFFQVRRSNRKTSKQISDEAKHALRDTVLKGTNERLLEVYKDVVKGRGIRTKVNFEKGDFVVEYRGVMMEYSEAKVIEEQYSNDEEIGSYMYFFEHNNKKWCIDATKESPWKGRLINHSVLRPNLKTKVVEIDGSHHLILVARRQIAQGEELLYDYGDRSAETIAKNPWLVNT
ncbi:Histone-lysine N-methyltransferase set-1 [Caenorhabditis elegans]|uniref:Histone-lysine N-methyltransferase set-1 n=2 Tax=Caenorhabditis elegans TaxID=6239 RepID=KMT5A_CAEEL|nr:Histone-lysine N-methyltransferase set-1 [Caenorhabditis elegans]Q22795.2 RecName: Full=Histone-lysine N-methyltransferase set-1 [Caenorhabditis elegans]CCD63213.1 Histone-lysine N-methyltransferase set-1 [Caenorhabditis elegans]|eukprot:NP_001022796.1 Histone-lysine N-methyltransferase set-1 [Caenorhabditis elegans]